MKDDKGITWFELKTIIPLGGLLAAAILGYANIATRQAVIETKIDSLTILVKSGTSLVDKENQDDIEDLGSRVTRLEARLK